VFGSSGQPRLSAVGWG